MGVYIKDMTMPKNCADCPCMGQEFFRCNINGARFFKVRDSMAKRHPDCPLIEVSKHGRLIDADALCELCDIMADKCDEIGASIWNQFRTTVEWSPTIIEAEG